MGDPVPAVLALENLFDLVRARMSDDGILPLEGQRFGWKEPNRQDPVARIVWVPGDPEGNLGDFAPPKYPGDNPRALVNLNERWYVNITGLNPGRPDDERAQYHATRLLYDEWLRAVYLAAHGTFGILQQRWINDKNERRAGAALQVVGTIQAVIPDYVIATAPTDSTAIVAPLLEGDPTADPPHDTPDDPFTVVSSDG